MTHRFPIKEIAAQSGLSTATVDRVLNARSHVSPQTKARVAAALAELKAQEGQLSARGRRMFVDIVIEAPLRFSSEVRAAAKAALPSFHPVALRLRFAVHEVMQEAQTLAVLSRIARRGSHGVCLKARDLPSVRRAIADLAARGIPVVTIFTDIPTDDRLAYAGLDNRRAGETAGWLMAQRVQAGTVVTTQSHQDFQGEGARLDGFRKTMRDRAPDVRVIAVQDASGLNADTARLVEKAAATVASIEGVYSVGGGNRAVTALLKRIRKVPLVYIAHDLDADNVQLLTQEALSYVLYHDLEGDMRHAFRQILTFHRLVTAAPDTPSDIQIIVPGNIPRRFQ